MKTNRKMAVNFEKAAVLILTDDTEYSCVAIIRSSKPRVSREQVLFNKLFKPENQSECAPWWRRGNGYSAKEARLFALLLAVEIAEKEDINLY